MTPDEIKAIEARAGGQGRRYDAQTALEDIPALVAALREAQSRAMAAEADALRLLNEAAALDDARRAAEAACAEMREALGKRPCALGGVDRWTVTECIAAGECDCDARAALKEPTHG